MPDENAHLAKKKVVIMDVPIDAVTKTEVLDMIFDQPKNTSEKGKHIITVNPEMILAAQKDTEFMDILQRADMNTADGNGILWAANTQRNAPLISLLKLITLLFKKPVTPLSKLVKGSDLILDIAKRAAQTGDKIFLLGAQPGVAKKAKTHLEKISPGVRIIGTHAGSPSPDEEQEIRSIIKKTQPDILLVAYGAPAQEKWIARNLEKMPSVRTAIGVGGTFDYLAGEVRRAPAWMQRLGLEWLYRLIREPKRLKRIMNAVVIFPIKVMTNGKVIQKKNSIC